MASIISNGGPVPEIMLHDEIGPSGVTSRDVAEAIKGLGDMRGKPLALRINSPGGDVFMGNGIFNLLRNSGARITVYIDGLAASMASLIAMVGTEIIIAENAQMMVHNPSGRVGGSADDLRRTAGLLESLRQSMVATYAKRTGMPEAQVARLMADETWFDSREAVRMGFADRVVDDIAIAAQVRSFDLSGFKRAPSTRVVARTQTVVSFAGVSKRRVTESIINTEI